MAKRILIVEDNELNLKLFCDLLRAHGHAAIPLRDPRDAIRTARDERPDLVITDIQLPHLSGLELIRAFQADVALAGVPIMAVTAYAEQGDEDRVRQAGARAFVSKPISLARFMEAVNALV